MNVGFDEPDPRSEWISAFRIVQLQDGLDWVLGADKRLGLPDATNCFKSIGSEAQRRCDELWAGNGEELSSAVNAVSASVCLRMLV